MAGEQTVAGMPPSSYHDTRMTVEKLGLTTMASYAVWDVHGVIGVISRQAYAAIEEDPEEPEGVGIPASLLFAAVAAHGLAPNP